MDSGPFGASRSGNRSGATTRHEPATRAATPAPATTTVAHHDTPTHHVSPRHEKPKKKKGLAILIVIVAIIALAVAGFCVWKATGNAYTGIDRSKFQAVFMTNGQVYFGKLEVKNDTYLRLTNVFYLQSQSTGSETDSKNPQESTGQQSNVQLIKLGDEVHGPEDAMIIERSQVLFYENLKDDGKVAQAIQQHESSKN